MGTSMTYATSSSINTTTTFLFSHTINYILKYSPLHLAYYYLTKDHVCPHMIHDATRLHPVVVFVITFIYFHIIMLYTREGDPWFLSWIPWFLTDIHKNLVKMYRCMTKRTTWFCFSSVYMSLLFSLSLWWDLLFFLYLFVLCIVFSIIIFSLNICKGINIHRYMFLIL